MLSRREQFATAVPPVAPIGGFFAGAIGAAALAAALTDAFAFRAFGRAEAVTPNAVLFIFASALGVDRNRVPVTALWLATALGVIAILRMVHAQSEHAWVGSKQRMTLRVAPTALALAVLAAAGAAYAGPRLPGANERGLVDTHRRTDITQVLSPLVDIRSQLINLPNLEMFTVEASEADYWRSTGLSRFDGTTWGLPKDEQRSSTPEATLTNSASHLLTHAVRITSLGGVLLPAAYSVVRVDDPDVFWIENTGSLVVPDEGLQQGDTYVITSLVVDPTVEELRAAGSGAPSPIYLELPSGVPQEAVLLAQQVTASGATAYDKVRLLQDWFRTEFVYDLTVQRGHSNNAISNFLRVRRGYCEQFAGTFAAMARSLGIPARVAVGFTQGELGKDGLYHVFGRNAHAWNEVYFDGIGWVSFDPTPGRGQPGQEDTTGAVPAQASPTAGNRGGDVGTVTASSTPRIRDAQDVPTFSSTLSAAEKDKAATAARQVTQQTSHSWPYLLVLAIVLAGAAWMLLMPRFIAWVVRRREPVDPAETVRHNWNRARAALAVVGVEPDPSATPCELAQNAHRLTGVDKRSLDELADHATASFFGGIASDRTAQRSESLANIVLISVRERLTTRQRVMSHIDPRLAFAVSPVRSALMPTLTGHSPE